MNKILNIYKTVVYGASSGDEGLEQYFRVLEVMNLLIGKCMCISVTW